MFTLGKKLIKTSLGQKAKDAVIKGVKVSSLGGPVGLMLV